MQKEPDRGGGGRLEEGPAGEAEIRRVAALMRIDIGAGGEEEARAHVEKVRRMIEYFDALDRAGVVGGEEAEEGGAGGAGGGAAVQLADLREDEPEEDMGGGSASGAGAAGRRYARVQGEEEGEAYVRAPAVSA